MSQSRKEIISQYVIQEPGLQNLINDLYNKPEDVNNIAIIKNALRGLYSDVHSSPASQNTTLITHLEMAGYKDLAKNAEHGQYHYHHAAVPPGIVSYSNLQSILGVGMGFRPIIPASRPPISINLDRLSFGNSDFNPDDPDNRDENNTKKLTQ